MRVAIPYSDRLVAQVFDDASSLLVVDLDCDGCMGDTEFSMRGWSLRERAKRLASMGVDTVLCNEISYVLENMCSSRGVGVVKNQIGNVDEVLEAYREKRCHNPRSSRKQPAVGAVA